ncbi:MAG: 30S ribosomal protein S18 [Candidatus Omnitrophota bacterium]
MARRKPRSKKSFRTRKRPAKYVIPADAQIEYKDLDLLRKFTTDRGKILARRLTGITARQQHDLTRAVKRGRYLGLLPVGGARR